MKNQVNRIMADGTRITPQMVMENPKLIPADALRAIKAIDKANTSAENALYKTAYNLHILAKKQSNGKSLAWQMGYNDIRDYAEVFHNIAGATAYAYAQTAGEFLKIQEDGSIHSDFTTISDTGKVIDFTVTQLMEIRGIPKEVISAMLENGAIHYSMTTKGLRIRKQAVKALTNEKSENYVKDATPEMIASMVLNAVKLLDSHTMPDAIAMATGKAEPQDDFQAEPQAEPQVKPQAEPQAEPQKNPLENAAQVCTAISNLLQDAILQAQSVNDTARLSEIAEGVQMFLDTFRKNT